MKILLVMDPGILIPVKGYGGIERIIEMLAIEYRDMGHEVHLLVTTGSAVEGCTVFGVGREGFPPKWWDAKKAVPSVWKFLWKNRNNYDLVHNFGRLAYLLPILNHPVKKIMSYQREITRRNIVWINTLQNRNVFFTACSQDLVNRAGVKGRWEAIHNGCDFNRYVCREEVDAEAPLIFLGRIERIKGCHTAIQVAKATGNRLVIAGNVSNLPEEKTYFKKEIAPHIDGMQIQHVGTVNDAQKNELLGKARALLFPIEWEEPFGIVMVEAMACGTPVIGFKRGAVDEVIDEGVTGFKVEDETGMIQSISKLRDFNRTQCAHWARKRFNSKKIARHYLQMVSECRQTAVILSTHQPAANPRALKEYMTLKEQGFAVKYLYSYNYEWSYKVDETKFMEAKLARTDFVQVAGNPHKSPVRYFLSRVIFRVCRTLAAIHPFFRKMASSRAAFSLWCTTSEYPADIYIAHYLGALPAAVRAAKRHRAKLIFDAEDFHRGESGNYTSQVKNIEMVEDRLLPSVNLLTAASPLIAEAYKNLYPEIAIETINNVFSREHLHPVPAINRGRLNLFWFSQNIGPDRGLEIFIQALNELPEADISLTLLGNLRSKAYEKELLSIAIRPSRIYFRSNVPPEEIFSIAAGYDIGLAGELQKCLNRQICLTNKIFTYILSGNCVLASDTPAQKLLLRQCPGIGLTYRHDDPKDLASKINKFYTDREFLYACRQAAAKQGDSVMNWEREKNKWEVLVMGLLQNNNGCNGSVEKKAACKTHDFHTDHTIHT
ncbi:MAG TPA: glycosyltransferase [Flavisolibacter sp.]|nr:glycosyltransferase [Flavisolibacter sp.]